MDVVKASVSTFSSIKSKQDIGRDPLGKSVSHALWMLKRISKGFIVDERAHRWLGYAQGLLVVHGELTLDEVRNINLEA